MGSASTEFVQVKELKMGMKNINVVLIVLEVGPPTLTKEAREVRTLRVADASACVNLSVWDAAGAVLQPGDIVRVSRGYTNLWRGMLTLYTGKGGDLSKVGEFCMLFNEQLNMSEPQPTPPPLPALPVPVAPSSGQPPALAQTQTDGKATHKTYVRGGGGGAAGGARTHQRNNSRR